MPPSYEEPECLPQKDARERLQAMRLEMEKLRTAQARGEAPPADHPTEAMIEAKIGKEMEWLGKEAERPASQRLPVISTPPREVLNVGTKLMLMEDPPAPGSGGSMFLQLVRVIFENENHKMALCFGLSVASDETHSIRDLRRAAMIPWQREMGFWSPTNWAWLLATILKRTGWPLKSLSLAYKLQNRPQEDFVEAVHRSFVDITYTERYEGSLDHMRGIMFLKSDQDMDMLTDFAYLLDSEMWEAACEVGLHMEDRTETPALTFKVGDAGGQIVVDGKTGKRWKSQTAYVKDRLKNAVADESLSPEEAEKHRQFMLEVLQSQRIKELSESENNMIGAKEVYREYAERKLGKRLRKIARKHDMTIPVATAMRTAVKCDFCQAAEGTARDQDGNIILKFYHCPCNPEGRPLYCSRDCQVKDRDNHREFCTAASSPSKSKSKKKENGPCSGEDKKKKAQKKKNKRR